MLRVQEIRYVMQWCQVHCSRVKQVYKRAAVIVAPEGLLFLKDLDVIFTFLCVLLASKAIRGVFIWKVTDNQIRPPFASMINTFTLSDLK